MTHVVFGKRSLRTGRTGIPETLVSNARAQAFHPGWCFRAVRSVRRETGPLSPIQFGRALEHATHS